MRSTETQIKAAMSDDIDRAILELAVRLAINHALTWAREQLLRKWWRA